MNKILTKADLIREVEQQHVALTQLRIGVVSEDQLCTILEMSQGELAEMKTAGLPRNKTSFLGLVSHYKISDVVAWLIREAHDEGRASAEVSEYEALRIRKLAAEVAIAEHQVECTRPVMPSAPVEDKPVTISITFPDGKTVTASATLKELQAIQSGGRMKSLEGTVELRNLEIKEFQTTIRDQRDANNRLRTRPLISRIFNRAG